MNDLDDLRELSELKGMMKEHSIECDYLEVFRMIEKLESMINKKHELIQEKFRLKEYALHCCEQANKYHCGELRKKDE